MIGTLLDDIASGMDFESVSRRFAEKMSPALKDLKKGYWRISKSLSLNNKYLESLGFVSLTQTYEMLH